jgi:hypothetical protein
MKIEVGKYYRTRDGRKVGPMDGRCFKWVVGSGSGVDPEWNNDGTCREGFTTYDDELIAEWTDTPKTWGEMTDAERKEISFYAMSGKCVQLLAEWPGQSAWLEWDGKTPLCELHQKIRIKPQPQRETVTLYTGKPSSDCNWGWTADNSSCGRTHRITFTTTDGEPDLDSIKMEEV